MEKTAPKRQRTCIACASTGTKTGLYRFVRNADGSVSFDPSGRSAGRGAYVCGAECFSKAATGHRLDRALRTKLTNDDYRRLEDELMAAMGASDE